MSLRTFVSFEASASKEGDPPGRELADALVSALEKRGFEVRGPEEYEGWAWTFGRSFDGGGILSLLGLTDDPPVEWQVHSYAQRSRPRLFGGLTTERLEEQIRAWVEALHVALRDAPHVRSIRWYDQATFAVDHGETWFDTPTD